MEQLLNNMTNEVSPENLEKWLLSNPGKIYARTVETAIKMVDDENLTSEAFMEFEWDNKIYSKIYMKKTDIPKAMEKAIEYFVNMELFEYAQMAKNAKDSFEKSQKP